MNTTPAAGLNAVQSMAAQSSTSTNTTSTRNVVSVSSVTILSSSSTTQTFGTAGTPSVLSNVGINCIGSVIGVLTPGISSIAQTTNASSSSQQNISRIASTAQASIVPVPAVTPTIAQPQSSSAQSTTQLLGANLAAPLALLALAITSNSPASVNAILSASQSGSNQPSQSTLWDHTISKLNLTPDEKSVFKINVLVDPTERLQVLTDIQEQAKKAMEICRQNQLKIKIGNKTIILRDVMNKVLFQAEKLKDVGDALNQYPPEHTTIPWAAVRLVLTMSLTERDRREMALLAIEAVSRQLIMCDWYQRLYLKDAYGPRTRLENEL